MHSFFGLHRRLELGVRQAVDGVVFAQPRLGCRNDCIEDQYAGNDRIARKMARQCRMLRRDMERRSMSLR